MGIANAAFQLDHLRWGILFLVLIEPRYAVELEYFETCVLRHKLGCGFESGAIVRLTP